MPLYILKLGGSAITDKKSGRFQVRKEALLSSAKAISSALKSNQFSLILVHGAGPFGHKIVHDYGISEGVRTQKQLEGFVKTRASMQLLNKQVMDALISQKINAVSLQPSACIIQDSKKIVEFDTEIIQKLLSLNTIPVLYGDMVIDLSLGASVVSGDAIVAYLAKALNADKVFFGTDVDGIYDSDPNSNSKALFLQEVNDYNICSIFSKTTESSATDVTSGMKGKLFEIKENIKGKECFIFNLNNKKNLPILLEGKLPKCTRIHFK